jgi:hypothetical protein
MPSRIVFLSGQETAVAENESDVVAAVRRDHPNPVKLEGLDGLEPTLPGDRPSPGRAPAVPRLERRPPRLTESDHAQSASSAFAHPPAGRAPPRRRRV